MYVNRFETDSSGQKSLVFFSENTIRYVLGHRNHWQVFEPTVFQRRLRPESDRDPRRSRITSVLQF